MRVVRVFMSLAHSAGRTWMRTLTLALSSMVSLPSLTCLP